MEIKDQIKRSVSITELISSYGIEMKPAGKNYKALCPFHNEKTPSFFAKPESDLYACYGCNKFGDIFSFVQEIENVGFREAMEFLIDRFNLKIEKIPGSGKFKEKNIYYEINSIVLDHYYHNLTNSESGKDAMRYLKERGISPDTIQKFSLGFAVDSWTDLLEHLKKSKIELKPAEILGLLIKNDKNEYYDRFRGRIIFPIRSESGKVIAFGGRTITGDKAKYLNSPESPVYSKGKNLYGFNITKEFMRELGESILVEGYFDVVSLFQNGIKNVTASLGTALTPEQIYLLKRYSEKVFFAYDNDEAGIKATMRGIERMFEQNINPRVIEFGNSKDPDEFIKKEGNTAFAKRMNSSNDGFRFILNGIEKKYDLSIPEQKKRAVDDASFYTGKFESALVREGYVNIAADFFGVSESYFKTGNLKKKNRSSSPRPLEISPAERILLTILLHKPGYINEIEQFFNDKLLGILNSGNIIRSIFNSFKENSSGADFQRISRNLSNEESALVRSVLLGESPYSDQEKTETVLESTVLSLLSFQREKELLELGKKIRRAERENRMDVVKKLIIMKTKLLDNKYSDLRAGGNVGNSQ